MAKGSLITLIIVLIIGLVNPAVAQHSAGTHASAGVGAEDESVRGPRQQLATIIFAGLGGAILGLSTLSFYGRPQERLSNIAVGFAVGIIIGATYTTYLTATAPYYSDRSKDITVTNSELLIAKTQRLIQAEGMSLEQNPMFFSYQWSY